MYCTADKREYWWDSNTTTWGLNEDPIYAYGANEKKLIICALCARGVTDNSGR